MSSARAASPRCDGLPRARRAGRADARRGADLRRRARGRARGRAARVPVPDRRRRRAARRCWPTAFERTGARVFYCQPMYANPHGATLSPARRAAVLDVVAAAGAFVVEDDWAPRPGDRRRGAAAAGRRRSPRPRRLHPLAVQAGGARACASRLIGARGAAGERLRLGAHHRRLLRVRAAAGGGGRAGRLPRLAAAPARAARRAARAPRRARRRRRADLPGAGARRCVPRGGLHSGFALPDGADDTAIAAAAGAGGVTVSPGRAWFAAEPPAPHLRLSFAGADPARLAEGVRRLAAAAPELAG